MTDGTRPHPEGGGKLGGLWVAGQVLPEAALVHVVLAADGARMGRRATLRSYTRGVGVLVNYLHVLHELLSCEAELLTVRAVEGVGSPDVAGMLGCVGPQGALGSEAFPADVAMERAVLHAFQLGVVVSQVLLEVGQLDKRAATIR